MSKKGRGRRTLAQAIEAREIRSTIGYLQRMQREVNKAKWEKLIADMSAEQETPVSETGSDAGSK